MIGILKKQMLIGLFLLIFLGTGPVLAFAQEDNANNHVGESHDGLRVFGSAETSTFGYMNEEGEIIVPCKYSSALDFINGVVLVCETNGGAKTYRAINTNGDVLHTFDAQLGSISYFDGTYGIATKYHEATVAGRSALIDENGQLITGYDYYSLFSEKSSPAYGVLFAEKVAKNSTDVKRGIISKDGKVVVPLDYFHITNTEEVPGVLSVGKEVNGQPKFGYLYSNGATMLPCEYDYAGNFVDSFGIVQKGTKYAAIAMNGQFITEFIYDAIDQFSEGLAPVVKNGKYGMIDTTGQEVISCKYVGLSASKNGIIKAKETESSPEVQIKNPLTESRKINIYKANNWVYTDQEPIIENDLTLAPLRKTAESLGYMVEWQKSSQSIILQNKERIIKLKVGEHTATVNVFDDGKAAETISIDAAPVIRNGRTLVPVRFVAESTGANVSWEGATKTIRID